MLVCAGPNRGGSAEFHYIQGEMWRIQGNGPPVSQRSPPPHNHVGAKPIDQSLQTSDIDAITREHEVILGLRVDYINANTGDKTYLVLCLFELLAKLHKAGFCAEWVSNMRSRNAAEITQFELRIVRSA